MRELEFVPSWYAQAARCRRLVVLQAWLTVVIALGLAGLILRDFGKDGLNDLPQRALDVFAQ